MILIKNFILRGKTQSIFFLTKIVQFKCDSQSVDDHLNKHAQTRKREFLIFKIEN